MGHLPRHFQDKIKSQDIARISRTSGHPVQVSTLTCGRAKGGGGGGGGMKINDLVQMLYASKKLSGQHYISDSCQE